MNQSNSNILSLSDNDVWIANKYKRARQTHRKIIAYLGPTNSGKTHRAFSHFMSSASGIYLGPLRLLAHEGYVKFQNMGFTALLRTGEESLGPIDAPYVSSTIEMLDLNREYDIAIIDEIQMISDEDRGWAWWRALLGCSAKTLILAGSTDALPVLQQFFAWLGEPIEIHLLDRKNELKMSPTSIGLDFVKPGSAVIAFSRKDIMRLKIHFDQKKISTAVVYGNLSPEVRQEEARRFREGDASILLSTDAIAMGLNMPISHIHFYSVCKFNGVESKPVDFRLIQQIAGRAGRYGLSDAGTVSGMSSLEHQYIKLCLDLHLPLSKIRIQYQPDYDEFANIHEKNMKKRLNKWLQMQPSSSALLAKVSDDMFDNAILIDSISGIQEKIPLPLIWSIIIAPIDDSQRSTHVSAMLKELSERQVVRLSPIMPESLDQYSLKEGELLVKWLNVYRWLHYRHPDNFPDLEVANTYLKYLNDEIEKVLRQRLKVVHSLEPASQRYLLEQIDIITQAIGHLRASQN